MARDLTIALLSDHQLILSHSPPLSSTLEFLSTQFKDNQDQVKFDICQLLTDVLLAAGESAKSISDEWLASIAEGLHDILQSKLGWWDRWVGLTVSL